MSRLTLFYMLTCCSPILARAVAEDQYFDSDSVKIRYIDVGPRDGEPIVLVHGFSQSIESAWMESGVIDALDDEYRVIAFDCRGHGKSDKPHDPRKYGNEFVEDIIRLLDHLSIEKAHVVGYSMGGRIVAKLVADHPGRLKTAMPSGTSMEPPEPSDREFVELLATSLDETGSIRPAIEHFNTDGTMTEEQIEQAVVLIRNSNDTKALSALIRSVDELLSDRATLEANTVPCLSIVGDDDPNLTITRKTKTYMANLDLHVIEGANHLTAYRAPAFIKAVKTFVTTHGQDGKRR